MDKSGPGWAQLLNTNTTTCPHLITPLMSTVSGERRGEHFEGRGARRPVPGNGGAPSGARAKPAAQAKPRGLTRRPWWFFLMPKPGEFRLNTCHFHVGFGLDVNVECGFSYSWVWSLFNYFSWLNYYFVGMVGSGLDLDCFGKPMKDMFFVRWVANYLVLRLLGHSNELIDDQKKTAWHPNNHIEKGVMNKHDTDRSTQKIPKEGDSNILYSNGPLKVCSDLNMSNMEPFIFFNIYNHLFRGFRKW